MTTTYQHILQRGDAVIVLTGAFEGQIGRATGQDRIGNYRVAFSAARDAAATFGWLKRDELKPHWG